MNYGENKLFPFLLGTPNNPLQDSCGSLDRYSWGKKSVRLFIQAAYVCACVYVYMHTVNVPVAVLLVYAVSPSVHAGTSAPGWPSEWGWMGCPEEQPAGKYWWG